MINIYTNCSPLIVLNCTGTYCNAGGYNIQYNVLVTSSSAHSVNTIKNSLSSP